jgi:phage terminase large subunit-like protein
MARPGRQRKLPPDTDIIAFLRALPPERRALALARLGEEEGDALDRAWPDWAHDGQAPPDQCPDRSGWRTWVVMAGRGFGKTRAGAEWIVQQIASRDDLRIALVAATLDEARRIMIEGRSGLLNVGGAWVKDWHPTLRRLTFVTGAEATLFSGASPEQLRGPEHHFAWCDELAKWERSEETWDMLQLGLRLGSHPRALVTTTPRPGAALEAIMAQGDTIVTGGPSRANPHVPEAWLKAVEGMYAGTRLGAQELEGELLGDRPGQLWTVELIERCRLRAPPPTPPARAGGESKGARETPLHAFVEGRGVAPPFTRPAPPDQGGELVRLVIAVDPPAAGGTCGIIACAKDSAGIAHVLADHSVTGRSPQGWARAVADAAMIWSRCQSPSLFPGEGRGPVRSKERRDSAAWAPALGEAKVYPERRRRRRRRAGEQPVPIPIQIIAEKNQGGDMVKAILLTADPSLKVKLVTATRDKAERAAPVAHLFEAGKVVLHGRFEALEKELLGMVAGEPWKGPGKSPDRADALVWGITELMLGKERAEPRIVGF